MLKFSQKLIINNLQIQDVDLTSETDAQLFELNKKIDQGMASPGTKRPFVVAIDGMSGSGKSTLGLLLQQMHPESTLFHMDHYFLQAHQRTTQRLAEIGGNIDYERFKAEILLHLADRDGLKYRTYDCHTQNLSTEIYVPWKPLIIIEGTYSQHPYFGDIYDLCIFCQVTTEEQRKRILQRDGKKMLKRFETEWIPKENAYFKTLKVCK